MLHQKLSNTELRNTIERVGLEDALLLEIRAEEIADPDIAKMWGETVANLKHLRAVLKVSDELDDNTGDLLDEDLEDDIETEVFDQVSEEELLDE